MKPQRKDVHINHSVADGINQPVLISNTAAPKALQIIFKRFGVSDAGKWMRHNIVQQC